jgi:hypothetical protein
MDKREHISVRLYPKAERLLEVANALLSSGLVILIVGGP